MLCIEVYIPVHAIVLAKDSHLQDSAQITNTSTDHNILVKTLLLEAEALKILGKWEEAKRLLISILLEHPDLLRLLLTRQQWIEFISNLKTVEQ